MPSGDRAGGEEWLDQSFLAPAEVVANLRDIEFINHHLGGTRSVMAYAELVLSSAPLDRPVRVLDIACGGGDLLRALSVRAHELGRAVIGVGLDLNPLVLAHARTSSPRLTRWSRRCRMAAATSALPASLTAATRPSSITRGRLCSILRTCGLPPAAGEHHPL